jgi:multidrug transporter EmrE-like cation transporter
MNWIALLVLSIISQIIAEGYVKSYSLSGNLFCASFALTLQIVSSITWLWYMRIHSTLAIGSGIWSVSLLIASTFIGVAMYHETVSVQQGIGLVFALISLCLLTL